MDILIIVCFFIISYLYASVGHGGASGYLALMAFLNFDPALMRSSALILNVLVSSIAFIQFYRGGHFHFKKLIPFIILSIPMAYIGSGIHINSHLYKIILGICLLFAIAKILHKNFFKPADFVLKPIPFFPAMGIGSLLGFVSGLIGIGGGIILSPILLIMRWATIKETAAISAAFILFNSLSGISGLWIQNSFSLNIPPLWIVAAVSGGLIGSWSGSFKINSLRLSYILASILLMASIKLFLL